MAHRKIPNFKHVKGVKDVVDKLYRLRTSMLSRGVELLFYITAAVHYDFVGKIVRGEVESKFELTPNSVCYLLDMKWDMAGHKKLFLLTGEYVKSIKIINIASYRDIAKGGVDVISTVVGIETAKQQAIAEKLERGGNVVFSLPRAGSHTYQIPERPLWERYKIYTSKMLKAGNYGEFEGSWIKRFHSLLENFAERVRDGAMSKNKNKVDINKLLSEEQNMISSYIGSNIQNGTGSMEELLKAAEDQANGIGRVKSFTDQGILNIAYKLRKYLDDNGDTSGLPDVFSDSIAEYEAEKQKAQSDKDNKFEPAFGEDFEYGLSEPDDDEPFVPF